MTERKADTGLDFEALRLGIERCDPDLVLGFYADDAQLGSVGVRHPRRETRRLGNALRARGAMWALSTRASTMLREQPWAIAPVLPPIGPPAPVLSEDEAESE